MKIKKLLWLLLSSTLLSGCLDTKTTKTSSTTTNNTTIPGYDPCYQNPSACDYNGTTTGTTNGNTTGETTGNTNGTTAGSTDGSTNTNSPAESYTAIDNNWTALYGSTISDFNCSTPYGSGFDLRKGTITISGGNTWYVPGGDFNYTKRTGKAFYGDVALTSFNHNISHFLTTVEDAKLFYQTDSKLKVRFKIREQPLPSSGQVWCNNRQTGLSRDPYGYTILKFNVSVVGLNQDGSLKKYSDGTLKLESTKLIQSAPIRTCSPTIDFSNIVNNHPYGLVLVIHDVNSNQGCWSPEGCTSYKTLSRGSCWQMDIEASVDGTKDI